MPGGGHSIGEFNADFTPHGKGTEYRADGSEAANGQWRNGELHGIGEQIHPDGSRYEGEFTNGWHNGVGRRTWASGDVHEGVWVSMRNGRLQRSPLGLPRASMWMLVHGKQNDAIDIERCCKRIISMTFMMQTFLAKRFRLVHIEPRNTPI